MSTINLWAKDGYLSTPDGAKIYFWGFSKTESGPAQIPGPNIVVKQGEKININLVNKLSQPVSIVFPGQQGVLAGGQPIKPQYIDSKLISFVQHAEPNGRSISYSFTAKHPGTYIYESGTNPQIQVPIGLHGGLVVRPLDYNSTGKKTAYGGGTDTEFDREYVLITGAIDPSFHEAVEKGKPYRISNKFSPRYWTLNGRSAPDTTVDTVNYLPNQPYDSLIKAQPGEKVLIRYIGAGINNHLFYFDGNCTRIVAIDGRLLKNNNFNPSNKKSTVLVQAGQTYDQIIQWEATTIPQSFMLQSCNYFENTNWGKYPGGMMTMIELFSLIDPEVGVLNE